MTQPGYDPQTQVLNVGTFGDVGPPPAPSPVEVTPDAAPVAPMVPEGAIDFGPSTDVQRPVTGGAVPVNYGPAPPVGTPGLSPGQANVATLRNLETSKDIAASEGGEGNRSEQEAAKIEAQHEAEQAQRATDYEKFLKDESDKQAQRHAQVQQSYLDVQKATGNKKNAADDFWKDKSTGYRVLSGLAAFASGFGSSLLHETGNPYLEHLDKLIDQNWQAHRENVDDLFKQQVQQGKIGDDDESYRNFMAQAKLHAADLGEQHIKSQLERVKHTALGQNYVTLADKTINDIDQREVERRAAFAQAQAQAAAAQAAAYRAKQNEITNKYNESYKEHLTAGYGADQARSLAAQALQGAGYDRSLLAPLMEANGGQYNQKSGQFEFAEPERKPEENGVPTVDPVTGKPLKPEEREKLNQLKVDVNGVTRFANSPEDQKKVQQEITAHQTVTSFEQKLSGPDGWLAKLRNGSLTSKEVGEWEGARKASIESYKALSGAEGNTGIGTARLLGEDEFPEPPSLATNVIVPGVLRNQQVQKYLGQVANMKALTDRTGQAIERRLRPGAGGKTAAPEQEAYKPKSFQPSK